MFAGPREHVQGVLPGAVPVAAGLNTAMKRLPSAPTDGIDPTVAGLIAVSAPVEESTENWWIVCVEPVFDSW